MSNSVIDVAYVAELARLELDDGEKRLFQSQLENIVRYVDKISGAEVSSVPPSMHGRLPADALRDDVVRPSMDRELALGNAPARSDTEFILPKIVEGAES